MPLPAISDRPTTYQIAGRPVSKAEFDQYHAWMMGPGKATASGTPTFGGLTIPGRGEVSPEEYQAYWTDIFRKDPEMIRIAQLPGDERDKEAYAQMRAQELGFQPATQDWSLDLEKEGFRPDRGNFWDRNTEWLIPAIAGGFMGAGALAGAGGGGAAAGGAAPAAGGGGAAAGGTAAATGGGVAGAATTAAAGGGILPAIAKYAGVAQQVGRGLGALSEGRAEGRKEEADAANEWDRLNILRNQQMISRANTELAQRRFGEELQSSARRNAPRASFLRNAQDVTFSNLPEGITIPTISGGLRPSAIRDRAEIGKTIYDQSMNELRDPLQPGTATSGRRMADLPVPDPISPTPGASGVDTALNYGSLITGTVLPAISGIYNARQAQLPPIATGGAGADATLASGINSAFRRAPRRAATATPQSLWE